MQLNSCRTRIYSLAGGNKDNAKEGSECETYLMLGLELKSYQTGWSWSALEPWIRGQSVLLRLQSVRIQIYIFSILQKQVHRSCVHAA